MSRPARSGIDSGTVSVFDQNGKSQSLDIVMPFFYEGRQFVVCKIATGDYDNHLGFIPFVRNEQGLLEMVNEEDLNLVKEVMTNYLTEVSWDSEPYKNADPTVEDIDNDMLPY